MPPCTQRSRGAEGCGGELPEVMEMLLQAATATCFGAFFFFFFLMQKHFKGYHLCDISTSLLLLVVVQLTN